MFVRGLQFNKVDPRVTLRERAQYFLRNNQFQNTSSEIIAIRGLDETTTSQKCEADPRRARI